ncbi:N-acetylmuramoyl-L-alanine amidase [Clostridium sp.]|uniref:N-acetylmuramoyl-L-alanine amidase n=1 Tax=Clostridium sp. TaxID=1506 RepID=UPI0025BBAE59|nr:N-acetylmuramoyl-L-alanine amidase [Clostridium sp.]
MKLNKVLLLVIIPISLLVILVLCKENLRSYFKISYRTFYNINISYNDLNLLEKDLNVIDLDYKWKEDLELNNNPNKIIYHHSARKEWSPEGINEYHKSKGWIGIGYHYYIRKDGSIYSGRPENAEGAHTKGENNNSIGICLEGNFEDEYPRDEQLESLYKLSLYISLKYDIYKIIGHKDVYSTLCPGENFSIEDIRNQVISLIKNYNNAQSQKSI